MVHVTLKSGYGLPCLFSLFSKGEKYPNNMPDRGCAISLGPGLQGLWSAVTTDPLWTVTCVRSKPLLRKSAEMPGWPVGLAQLIETDHTVVEFGLVQTFRKSSSVFQINNPTCSHLHAFLILLPLTGIPLKSYPSSKTRLRIHLLWSFLDSW